MRLIAKTSRREESSIDEEIISRIVTGTVLA